MGQRTKYPAELRVNAVPMKDKSITKYVYAPKAAKLVKARA